MLPLTKISLSRGLLACPWPSTITCHSQERACVRHWDGARGSCPSGGAASPTPHLSTSILDRGPLRKGVGRGTWALGRLSERTQVEPGQGPWFKVPAFLKLCKLALGAFVQNKRILSQQGHPAQPSGCRM